MSQPARLPDPALAARLRARAGGRCEYCGTDVSHGGHGAVDFHQPIERGGAADDDNALYCCAVCNTAKRGYWYETDPPRIRLLHPRRDALGDHLAETEAGMLDPRSDEGRFYIDRLRLNRSELVRERRTRGSLMRAWQGANQRAEFARQVGEMLALAGVTLAGSDFGRDKGQGLWILTVRLPDKRILTIEVPVSASDPLAPRIVRPIADRVLHYLRENKLIAA
jgi:hypothetical protein